jgi:hypothetical protein
LLHRENRQTVFIEGRGHLTPLEAARHWLAQQIESCPVRLDQIRRSMLFSEVEAAVTSIDNMNYHSQAISDSNHWCNYEVFLKACWRYLHETSRSETTLGAVVLLKMIQLYRRRPGVAYQKAALKQLDRLLRLLRGPSTRDGWLLGVTVYEQAYMKFLTSAPSHETETAFRESVMFEIKYGRPVGQFISHAQGRVAALRRGIRTGSNIELHITEFRKIGDQLSSIGGGLADYWALQNIPIHLAYADLRRGRYAAVVDSMKEFVAKGDTNALLYTGIAMLRSNEKVSAVQLLVDARRGFYREQRSEGRSGLLVALGDAYQMTGQPSDARKVYEEAIKQPLHMDNAEAIKVAIQRISDKPVRDVRETYQLD